MIKIKIKGNLLKEFNKVVKKEKNKVINKSLANLKAATPVDTGEAQKGWYRDGDTIRNDVDHIEYLNEGSSKQAPSHFIEKTLLAQKGIKPSGTIVR